MELQDLINAEIKEELKPPAITEATKVVSMISEFINFADPLDILKKASER